MTITDNPPTPTIAERLREESLALQQSGFASWDGGGERAVLANLCDAAADLIAGLTGALGSVLALVGHGDMRPETQRAGRILDAAEAALSKAKQP